MDPANSKQDWALSGYCLALDATNVDSFFREKFPDFFSRPFLAHQRYKESLSAHTKREFSLADFFGFWLFGMTRGNQYRYNAKALRKTLSRNFRATYRVIWWKRNKGEYVAWRCVNHTGTRFKRLLTRYEAMNGRLTVREYEVERKSVDPEQRHAFYGRLVSSFYYAASGSAHGFYGPSFLRTPYDVIEVWGGKIISNVSEKDFLEMQVKLHRITSPQYQAACILLFGPSHNAALKFLSRGKINHDIYPDDDVYMPREDSHLHGRGFSTDTDTEAYNTSFLSFCLKAVQRNKRIAY